MNITLLPSGYLPNIGGLERAVNNLAKRLKMEGHKVNIITTRYPLNLKSEEKIDNILVDRLLFLPVSLSKPTISGIVKYVVRIFLIPWTSLRLLYLLKKNGTRVVNLHFVQSNAFYLLLVSYFISLKIVVSLHGHDVQGIPFESRSSYWIFCAILKKADHITACSQFILDEAIKIVPDIRSKATVIHNGIESNLLVNARKVSSPGRYVLSIGRFVEKKGFDILIKAFKLVVAQKPDIALVIAGDGPEKTGCSSLIHKFGLEQAVTLYGPANREEVNSLLKGCEFFTLPSLKEPFGIVMLEAMVARKAVVATRVGGVPEVITDGKDGMLVKAGSPEALAKGILELLNDTDLRRKFEEAGFKTVKSRFTLKAFSEKYLTVYKRSINRD